MKVKKTSRSLMCQCDEKKIRLLDLRADLRELKFESE
jgi:hypothetical protein